MRRFDALMSQYRFGRAIDVLDGLGFDVTGRGPRIT
jgi:hypothetical protein